MSEAIILALIALAGTVIGPVLGILVSGKLTNYRIEQLETEVRKHNNVVERVYKLEEATNLQEQKISDTASRLEKLEGKVYT